MLIFISCILYIVYSEVKVMKYYTIHEASKILDVSAQTITVFSCKLQGKRANKAKKMIKELTENDKDD